MNHRHLILNRLTVRLLIPIVLLAGCSGSPKLVDTDAAHEALVTVMESWKQGKTPDDLLDERPSITVVETDWNDETKLLEYQLFDDARPAGPNLIARVKLKLGKPDGAVVEKTATYVVGTSPNLCVFRNLMK